MNEDQDSAASSSILMVCDDGAVKSVIAAQLFEQAASQRGLSFSAVARGLEPSEQVPVNIAQALAADGFDLSGFDPRELSSRDLASAVRVVAIGTDLSALQDDAAAPILQWGVPSTNQDYEAIKASLLTLIDALLDELEQ
ncbi:MAG: hypothetical protein AAF657_05720 [Acidobacteriota bacterium]